MAKTRKDISNWFAGQPMPVASLDLNDNLLVDTFGIYEHHAGQTWKVRLINNFRSNSVNSYAWLPFKMSYDSFDALQQAARILKQDWTGDLHLGKGDFYQPSKPCRRPASKGGCATL